MSTDDHLEVLNRGINLDGTKWRVVRVRKPSGGFNVRLEVKDDRLDVWRHDLESALEWGEP